MDMLRNAALCQISAPPQKELSTLFMSSCFQALTHHVICKMLITWSRNSACKVVKFNLGFKSLQNDESVLKCLWASALITHDDVFN